MSALEIDSRSENGGNCAGIFRNLQKFNHRSSSKDKYNITESGNKGAKIFLLKWGITIKFFKKYYLKSDTKFIDILDEPNINLYYLLNLLKFKLFYIYIKYIYKIKKNN